MFALSAMHPQRKRFALIEVNRAGCHEHRRGGDPGPGGDTANVRGLRVHVITGMSQPVTGPPVPAERADRKTGTPAPRVGDTLADLLEVTW